MWRNHFPQLLNLHDVNVRQTHIHTAEPLVPELSAFEIVMAIEKLKRHKSQGIYQIPTEIMKAGGRTIPSEIHKLIWNKEELPEQTEESIIASVHKKSDKTDCSKYRGITLFVNYVQNFIQHSAVKIYSICRGNYYGSLSGFQCIYSAFIRYLRKRGRGIHMSHTSALCRLQESL
jgi:hypothetical protein